MSGLDSLLIIDPSSCSIIQQHLLLINSLLIVHNPEATVTLPQLIPDLLRIHLLVILCVVVIFLALSSQLRDKAFNLLLEGMVNLVRANHLHRRVSKHSEENSLGQMSLENGLLEEPSIIGIHKKQEKLHAGCEAQKHERALVHGRIRQVVHPHVGQMAQAYE